MKKILIKSVILLLLYIVIYLYFAIFNWQVFTVTLNVNLGFGVVEVPPFIVLFLIGLIIIGILSWSNYMTRIRKMIYELEYGIEMGRIKDKLTRTRIKELLMGENNLNMLKQKMGIEEIEKKQEELKIMMSELKQQSKEQE